MTHPEPADDSSEDTPGSWSFNRSLALAIGLMQIVVGAYLIYLPFGLGDPAKQTILIVLGIGSMLLGLRKLYLCFRR